MNIMKTVLYELMATVCLFVCLFGDARGHCGPLFYRFLNHKHRENADPRQSMNPVLGRQNLLHAVDIAAVLIIFRNIYRLK